MKKNFKKEKRFIVRKYVMAHSAQEALKKERKYRPDDVYVDDEWVKNQANHLESAIGFNIEKDYEDDY